MSFTVNDEENVYIAYKYNMSRNFFKSNDKFIGWSFYKLPLNKSELINENIVSFSSMIKGKSEFSEVEKKQITKTLVDFYSNNKIVGFD